MDDLYWMQEALSEAKRAAAFGEVPVGAIVEKDGEIIARAFNRRESDQDPLAHAEILAIRQAAEVIGSWRLTGSTLYVTLEPCAMCAGALVLGRLDAVVFGARDPKAGFCGSLGNLIQDPRLNHRLEIRRALEEPCSLLLKDFFSALRRERRARREQRKSKSADE